MVHTVAKIGETAGRVWQVLQSKGAMSVSRIPKELEENSALVHQALGWLAREGKIEYSNDGKKTVVALSEK